MANTLSMYSAGGGMVTTDFGYGDWASYVLVQSDGKILVAGQSGNGANQDYSLARYNTSGSLDSSFSLDGKMTSDSGFDDWAHSMALQADGRIVVAGSAMDNFVNVRYNTDGSFNSLFFADFGGVDNGESVTVQSDGKIVVAGESDGDFAVARFNADGSLDASFDIDGKVITDLGGPCKVQSVTVQPDGKIVVAGQHNGNIALVRYNNNGSLDTTFSGDGIVITDFGGEEFGAGVIVQSDGKILVTGTEDNAGNYNILLVRYTSDGSLDTAFGSGGKATMDSGGQDWSEGLVLQSDGKILVAGGTDNGGGDQDFALLRFNSDGTPDTSFGSGGKVTTDFGGADNGESVAIQSDGKIVVAGQSLQGTNRDFALARYNSDGVLDPTFTGQGGFTGTEGNDVIYGDGSDSILYGLGGNDRLDGRAPDGSSGCDTLVGGTGNDTLLGDDGNDTAEFTGNIAEYTITYMVDGDTYMVADNISGRDGTDVVEEVENFRFADVTTAAIESITTVVAPQGVEVGTNGNDHLDGTGSNDTIYGLGGNDTIIGNEGNDALNGNEGDDHLAGDDGNDTLEGNWGNDSISGGSGNDKLEGGVGDDSIDGGEGDDAIDGNAGNNTLYGGDGDDSLEGGEGNHFIYGGAGNDVLEVEEGDSYLDGGDGNDELDADSGNDTMYGGAGNDTLDGSGGDNYLDGGDDDDVLLGDDDSDTLIGGGGNDTMLSDKGDDSLSGGDGNDYLHGEWGSSELEYVGTGELVVTEGIEDGNDTLEGGAGNDSLFGGEGVDTAVFSGNVSDYAIGYDNITATYTVTDRSAGRDGSDVISGVEYFRFADVTKSALDCVADTAPPTVSAFSPFDGAAGAAVGSDIVVTFSEAIQRGTGTIVIHSGSADGPVVESFNAATSTNLTISGSTLVINPTADLANSTHYYVTFSEGSVKDLAGNSYEGITSYDFTTEEPILTPVIRNGDSIMPDRYTGPATAAGGEPIHFEYLGDNTGEVLIGTAYNDFINVGDGVDAVDAGDGNDVIDGGTGSNFLSGGAGTDIFFSDGRGGQTTWSTIVDWQSGEQLSVWGWQPGVSHILQWVQAGAPGYEGLTMHADLNGDNVIDTSVTFTGIASQSQLPTPLEFDGVLWFT